MLNGVFSPLLQTLGHVYLSIGRQAFAVREPCAEKKEITPHVQEKRNQEREKSDSLVQGTATRVNRFSFFSDAAIVSGRLVKSRVSSPPTKNPEKLTKNSIDVSRVRLDLRKSRFS